jgi:hypothetical protein
MPADSDARVHQKKVGIGRVRALTFGGLMLGRRKGRFGGALK